MRIKALSAVMVAGFASFGLAACGGGDQMEEAPMDEPGMEEPMGDASGTMEPPASMELAMPEWMQVDATAQTVTIQLTAGGSPANNYWNYNGFYGGTGGITVPAGYTVNVEFTNSDPAMAHSFGVETPQATYPNQFTEVSPVFEGGASDSPLSMTEATLPGESEVVSFVASTAGDYVLICYVTGHAVTGMWITFTVSADGESGAYL